MLSRCQNIEPEFVLEEPREHPVRSIADELAEFRLGGNRLGQIVLLIVGSDGFGLVPVGKLVIAALRADFAGLRRFVIEGLNGRLAGGAELAGNIVRPIFPLRRLGGGTGRSRAVRERNFLLPGLNRRSEGRRAWLRLLLARAIA